MIKHDKRKYTIWNNNGIDNIRQIMSHVFLLVFVWYTFLWKGEKGESLHLFICSLVISFLSFSI